MELIRRLVLVVGVAGFLVLSLSTVPALVLVQPVDFAAELAREYPDIPGPPPLGIVERGRRFLLEETRPTSLAEYISRKTENRLLKVGGPEWEEFYASLAAPTPPSAWSRRRVKDYLVFLWPETPLAKVQSQIEEMSRFSTVIYLALGGGQEDRYLRVAYGYGYEPKTLGAPAALVYPFRPYSWAVLAVGLAGFFLLPRRRPGPQDLYLERASAILPLDLGGMVFFGLFFALPFWMTDPTGNMFGQDLGWTGFFWTAAAAFLAGPVCAASHASFAISLEKDHMTINRLLSTEKIAYRDIFQVESLQIGQIDSGLILELANHQKINLPWTNVVNYQHLFEVLKVQGIKMK